MAQSFEQICGTLPLVVEAPAVLVQGQVIQQIPQKKGWHWPWTGRNLPNEINTVQYPLSTYTVEKNTQTPYTVTISLSCEALIEIYLLQPWPLRTTQLLPCSCRDLTTSSEIHRFELLRAAQSSEQICGTLCILAVEAPAVLVQGQVIQQIPQKKGWHWPWTGRNLPNEINTSWYSTQYTLWKKHSEHLQPFLSLRGTQWNLPSSTLATSHHAAASMQLPEFDNIGRNARLPAPASGRELRADLRHPPLGLRSTCSVGPRSSHTTTSQKKGWHWPWNWEKCSKRDKY